MSTATAAKRHPMWSLLAILALRDVPFWTASVWRRLLRMVVLFLYGLVLLTFILLPFENHLAFMGRHDHEWEEAAESLKVRDLYLSASDGETIHAWLIAPDGWRPEQGALIYSHGNGQNLSHWQAPVAQLGRELNRAALIYDYPGYGKSTGRPTEQGCYAAIDAAYDHLVHEEKVPAKEIVLVGSSLGGAFATNLASRRECRMLLLMCSFTSFPDIAQNRYPMLPARWLVSNQMRSERKMPDVKAPVFIAHGTADRVVPFWMGERLYKAANEPKQFYPIQGHPHMDPCTPEFYEALREFLRETPR